MDKGSFATSVALFVCGIIFVFTKEKYLRNFVVSTNKYRAIKFDPNTTVRLMKLLGIGGLIVGSIGILTRL